MVRNQSPQTGECHLRFSVGGFPCWVSSVSRIGRVRRGRLRWDLSSESTASEGKKMVEVGDWSVVAVDVGVETGFFQHRGDSSELEGVGYETRGQ